MKKLFAIVLALALVLSLAACGGNGGTDVAAQNQMYGELLELPLPPTREGYRFTGWYTDSACYELWNVQEDTIEIDMTLYAGWEKLE